MQVVREFSRMLNDALDMRVEMRNMITFGEMLAHREHLEVPTPYEQLCSARVLTMSRVTGRPLDGADAIEGSGWDVEDVTSTVVSAYFEMIFNHGVFHADPQPGNLMVLPGKKLALLDFGDVGRLTPARRAQIERVVLALGLQDPEAFAGVMIDILDPPTDTNLSALQGDLSAWFDEHIAVGVGQIDVRGLVGRGMEILHHHHLVLPADFSLIIRVLLQLQGLSSAVGVSVNLEELVAPYVRRIILSHLDPRRIAREAASTGMRWQRLARGLPDDIRDLIKGVRQGTVRVNFSLHDPEGVSDNLVDGLITASALLSASQLISRDTGPKIAGISVPGAVAAGIGFASWARSASRRRERRSLVTALRHTASLGRSVAGRRRNTRQTPTQPE